jgi:hypothetical protein
MELSPSFRTPSLSCRYSNTSSQNGQFALLILLFGGDICGRWEPGRSAAEAYGAASAEREPAKLPDLEQRAAAEPKPLEITPSTVPEPGT